MTDDAADEVSVLPFEHAGVAFDLRVRRVPSGLAGQVFHGQELVAGVRLYHSQDVERLRALAIKDRAFQHAVARLTPVAG